MIIKSVSNSNFNLVATSGEFRVCNYFHARFQVKGYRNGNDQANYQNDQ